VGVRCRGSSVAEALAAHDPTNIQWQADVAVSCAKLGTFDHGVPSNEKRAFLLRGRQILVDLKNHGRLLPNQDWIAWLAFTQVNLTLPAQPRSERSCNKPCL
jgi:hypothetical protein